MIASELAILTVELVLAFVAVAALLIAGLALARRDKPLCASAIWLGWPVAIVGGCVLFGTAEVLTMTSVIGAVCVWFALPFRVLFGRPGLDPVLDAPRAAASRRHGWR